MHSTRMRTVPCSVWPGGSAQGVSAWGLSAQEGVCPGGVCPGGCLPGGCLSGRGCLPRGVSARHPPCGQNDRRVKTLPCHNYIADNNKNRMCTARLLTLSPSDRGGSPPGCEPPWNQTPGCSRPLVMWPVMHAGKPTTPPWTEWHTGVKTLPCPKLRLRAVIIIRILTEILETELEQQNSSCRWYQCVLLTVWILILSGTH